MSRTNQEPEYRRRIRDKAKKDQYEAETKRQNTADSAKHYEIVRSVYAIYQEYQRHNNEERSRKKGDRFWEIAGVLGLWLAAFVGIAAIWIGTHDAGEQRGIMRGQLDEMQLQLSATQRAWIKITEITLAPPGLKIDSTGALLQVSLKVRNTGNVPAIYGSWHVWLVPGAAGTGHDVPQNPRDRACDEIRKRPYEIGQTVFPNDDYPSRGTLTAGAGASREEIVSVFNRGQPKPNTFDLTIAGCFDYTFSTDPKNHHQTSFRRFLYRKVPGLRAIILLPFDYTLDMGTIAADELDISGDMGSAD